MQDLEFRNLMNNSEITDWIGGEPAVIPEDFLVELATYFETLDGVIKMAHISQVMKVYKDTTREDKGLEIDYVIALEFVGLSDGEIVNIIKQCKNIEADSNLKQGVTFCSVDSDLFDFAEKHSLMFYTKVD